MLPIGGWKMLRRSMLGSMLAVALVAAAVAPAAADVQAGKKPSGEPIKVMVAGDWTFPDGSTDNGAPDAVEARAKAINGSGGIQGRPVEVLVCDAALDPNKAEACAREAIDAGVVAFIGTAFNQSEEPRALPLLLQNDIAVIASVGQGALSLTQSNSFVVGNGTTGLFTGMGQVLTATKGAKKLAFVVSDLGGAAIGFFRTFLDAGLEIAGAELVGEPVLVPTDATDMAPYVAAATADDPDGVLTFITGDTGANFIQELRRGGYDGPVAAAPGVLGEELLHELGDAAKNVYAYSAFNGISPKVPGYKQFIKEMKSVGAAAELNERAVNAWLGMRVFEQVAADLPTIDRASVLAVMSKITDMDMGGITPPLTTTEPGVRDDPLLARIFDPDGLYLQAKGGTWKVAKASTTFFNVYTGEPTDVKVIH
jgi:ABC-type branched-subunit amino acid transport system substrate-binding protein